MLTVVWAATVQGQGRDSVVYDILPTSRLEVRTGRAGLLRGLGHEHLVRARAFHGRIVHVPATPERSHVALTAVTDSLEILTDANSQDVAKMTRTMREETLRVAEFPEIAFRSESVEPRDGGFRVSGAFTLVGQSRPVALDVEVAIVGDTLRAHARFPLKQTDFGIKPYGAGLGTVKVKDEVWFELDVVALRAP